MAAIWTIGSVQNRNSAAARRRIRFSPRRHGVHGEKEGLCAGITVWVKTKRLGSSDLGSLFRFFIEDLKFESCFLRALRGSVVKI